MLFHSTSCQCASSFGLAVGEGDASPTILDGKVFMLLASCNIHALTFEMTCYEVSNVVDVLLGLVGHSSDVLGSNCEENEPEWCKHKCSMLQNDDFFAHTHVWECQLPQRPELFTA